MPGGGEQRGGRQRGHAALRSEEMKDAAAAEMGVEIQPAAKIEELRAAAQCNVGHGVEDLPIP